MYLASQEPGSALILFLHPQRSQIAVTGYGLMYWAPLWGRMCTVRLNSSPIGRLQSRHLQNLGADWISRAVEVFSPLFGLIITLRPVSYTHLTLPTILRV